MAMADASPRVVLLFSGHMIDSPGRFEPRFPDELVGAAARQLGQELARLGAGPLDRALCGGAGGADLLFAEACAARGVPLEIMIPFEEERFLVSSVEPSGPEWRERFERLVASEDVEVTVTASGDESDLSPYERNNQRLLERALEWGPKRLRFLALWDGRSGDGAGGTADMVTEVRKHTSEVRIIDPSSLTSL